MKVALKDIRRTEIIDAALKMIAKLGIYNVRMEDISAASGLSKGGIAYYFRSRDLLFKESFEVFFERILVRSRQAMAGHSDPIDQLLAFEWFFNGDDPDIDIGYSLLLDCTAMALHEDDYRQLFQQWITKWVELFQTAVAAGIAAGKFEVADPRLTARAISAVYHGLCIRWYLDRKNHSSEWAITSARKLITGLVAP